MRRLSGIDAAFLGMESATVHGHVLAVSVFDPSGASRPFDAADVVRVVRDRLPRLHAYRWRLAEVPFGLARPYWIEDPDLDVTAHVLSAHLPPPGDERQFAELVGRIASRPLDRRRPLWELHVVTGLEGGRIAHVTKMHHAAVDGATGVEILHTLLDVSPEPGERDALAPPAPERVPSPLEMLGRGALDSTRQPGRAVRLAARMARVRAARAEPSPAGAGALGAPRTPFNRTLTAEREVAFASLSLAEVKVISHQLGLTVNDVVLAVCAGALRSWLLDAGQLPPSPLIAAVPISTRTVDQLGVYGNRVSLVRASLHTDVADELERLRRIHDGMAATKARPAARTSLLSDAADLAAPALITLASRAIGATQVVERVPFPYNVMIATVPGPPQPLYFEGARMIRHHGVSTLFHGGALNITVNSYQGELQASLITTPEALPDPFDLAARLTPALASLTSASTGSPSPPR